MENLLNHHHGAGPPAIYQQPHYILVDDQDHWPVASNGLPSSQPAGVPLPQLPGLADPPPGKPVLHAEPEDDDATESEDERGALGRSQVLPWHHHPPAGQQRPESALTATSQPSPTPSVSWTAPVVSVMAQSASAAPLVVKAGKATKSRKPGGKGVITLRLLIQEGILQPGHDVLSVDYKGMKQLATLMPDGRISSTINGHHLVFESPSAFSIYLKRLVNPSRKADDGWKTVRYNNRVLEHFKAELLKRQMGDVSIGPSAQHGMSPYAGEQQQQQQPPASKRARVDSSSDLTGGSVAVSASVKDGDRNVLKLKFARLRGAEKAVASPGDTQQEAVAAAQLAGERVPPEEQQEEKGDFVRFRPRRQVHKPYRYGALGQDDEHALQPLEAYGPGAPGTQGAQPYTLYVSTAAEVAMDFHAHLCMNEVIGVLAGTFDPTTRTVRILRAHPVRELTTEDDSINVEMDPEDEWRVRQQVTDSELRVVGWYHSHPTFPTQPSTIDIYNQALQQHHHRDEASGAEVYVAAIVGPYDKRASSAQSSITWFFVDHPPGALPSAGQRPEDVGCVAKALQALQLQDSSSLDIEAEVAAMPVMMLQLAQRYAGKCDAADLAGRWRDGESRAQKLVASLLSRLQLAQWSPQQQQQFGDIVHGILTTAFLNKAPEMPEAEPSSGTAATASGAVAAASAADWAATEPESDDEPISGEDE